MDFLSKELLYQKSPQELTSLLYEAAITKLEKAIQETKDKNYIEANQSFQRVNDILHRLGAGLNYESGIIADQLDAVYNFMAEEIVMANLKKDVARAEEVLILLKEITDSWNQATKASPGAKTRPTKANPYEQHVKVEVQDQSLNKLEAGK
ncbi:flagellar export chaperone FliS [Jeotgalibacillus haloalkalitolerans]|uniref:Flagellar export chaperone FliS n=1 Tax=Jeotgalibacillus haloalkalitolerans TaxID=3104292 RepID=A0ABU5KJN8_9BACL|nr:flagellar export chaperone FliS [Jeotgalibacillus sp. HH7-29]MDZ5711472.1 flagellar export chaperone FliS [Jeotgalibacillus sp. HH7-29]